VLDRPPTVRIVTTAVSEETWRRAPGLPDPAPEGHGRRCRGGDLWCDVGLFAAFAVPAELPSWTWPVWAVTATAIRSRSRRPGILATPG